jgi:MFS family permease
VEKTVKTFQLEPRIGGRMAWTVWILSVLFVIYLSSIQTGYSIVNPNIQGDIGLSIDQVGLIAATYTWSFAIFQLFSGALLDRLGARKVLPAFIAIFTLGVFIFSQSNSFGMLIIAQVVLALGACAGFVGAGYVGGQWFGMANFSLMFGLVQCFASLFSALNQNLVGFALSSLEWRSLFMWIGAGGIGLFILAIFFIRDLRPVYETNRAESTGGFIAEIFSSILRVAKIPHVWMAAIYGGLVFGTLLSAGIVWAPKIMIVHGMETDSANLSASMLWLGMAAGCLVIPWWSDYVKRRKRPASIGIALQLAALIVIVYLPQLNQISVIALWFIFGFGAAAMLAFSTVGDVVNLKLIGTSAAIVNCTMFLMGGALIARPGFLASNAIASGAALDLQLVMAATRPLQLALLIAFVVSLLIRETYPAVRLE